MGTAAWRPIPWRSAFEELIRVAAMVLAVKLGWLLLDATLRLYMGDSMVFMQSGAEFSGVGARSYPYGWILYLVAFPFKSPWAILMWQAAWGTLTCLGLFAFLRYAMGLTFVGGSVPAILLATEPAQVFMERMVMAESFGLLALVATLLLLSIYIARGHWGWYLLASLAGLLAAALRTNFLPVVLGLGVLVPFVRILAEERARGWASLARGMFVPLLILASCHLAYTTAYGRSLHHRPEYLANTGMMRIGLVAPLIRPEHFAGTDVPGSILETVKLPLADHWQRGSQIWSEDGLWRQIERRSANPEEVARVVTGRAMMADPLGLLGINIETLGGYFDKDKVYWRMMDDKGVIAPSTRDVELVRNWLDWDVRGVAEMETPARRLFAASTHWLTFCLFALAPLALVAMVMAWRSSARAQVLLLGLASQGLVASHLLFAHIVSFRYLHPFPWFVLANLAVICAFGFRLVQRNGWLGDRDGAGIRR